MAEGETRAPMRRWAADMQMYPMYPIRLALVASILGAPLPTRTTAGSAQGGTTQQEETALPAALGEPSLQRSDDAPPSRAARP